ncbi:hypothetical protein SAMN05192533_12530 [Mesobacillus persicus]|uniref:Uncharacterized protein n=1 Tax=Mesobacillus persicus TaxID=930146 RepID=A0A1H8K9M3_9BACI|nr:hypothetical protein [Mesobacillus persicus]SEN89196.1 hypothetical protein SAMN05192533_12530 [Mesobacillus persicus]
MEKFYLKPKEVTGTTRFSFDFDLSAKMFFSLINEFKDEYNQDIKNINQVMRDKSIKLVNEEKLKSLEITKRYISFYPPINEDGELELIKKRVYKIVSRRASVYDNTSKENLELSICSLISGELRTSASLLYYSLHKFFNGKMYHYFNDVLKIDDNDVSVKELGHFTSAIYYKFISENSLNTAINRENYRDNLCINKSGTVDPFKILNYICDFDNDLMDEILPYVLFLSKNLFDLHALNEQTLEYCLKKVESFRELKKEEQTQELQVEAAIADALAKYIEEDTPKKKVKYLIIVLTLRLYWLRQTADYDFDFEVKTSTREMSFLLASTRAVFLRLNNEKKQKGERLSEKEDQEELIEDSVSGELDVNLDFYQTRATFPKEIKSKTNYHTFLSAVHLDYNFDKDLIINILNLTDRVTNEGNLFVYKNENPASKPLNIFINDDGRWTVWLTNESKDNLLISTDIVSNFKEFIHMLKKNFKIFTDNVYEPILISSLPIYSESYKQINSSTLFNMGQSLLNRVNKIKMETVEKIADYFRIPFGPNFIVIGDFTLIVNVLYFPQHSSIFYPWTRSGMEKVKKGDLNEGFLTIVVSDEEENELADRREYYKYMAYKAFITEDTEELNADILFVHPVEFDNFLEGNNTDSKVYSSLVNQLNSICYNKITEGITTAEIKEILEKCIEKYNTESFPYATLGAWYLRNEKHDLSVSLEKGKEYYELALNVEKEYKDSKYLLDMQLKYYYEVALYHFKRTKDMKLAKEYIEYAESVVNGSPNQDLMYSYEIEDLKKKIISLNEVAVAKEGEIIN